MPASSKRSLMRLRSSRATRHWSAGALDRQPDRDRRVAELIDSPQLRFLEDVARMGRIPPQRVGRLLDQVRGLVVVGAVGDADVEDDPGPALGLVPDLLHDAVGNEPQRPFDAIQ
jgi:hypothetical protein